MATQIKKRPTKAKKTHTTGSAYWIGNHGFAKLEDARDMAAKWADEHKMVMAIYRKSDSRMVEMYGPDKSE